MQNVGQLDLALPRTARKGGPLTHWHERAVRDPPSTAAHRHTHAVRARALLLTAHDWVGVVRVVVRVDQRAHLANAAGDGNVENPGADQ